jgi:hypothetical protein
VASANVLLCSEVYPRFVLQSALLKLTGLQELLNATDYGRMFHYKELLNVLGIPLLLEQQKGSTNKAHARS